MFNSTSSHLLVRKMKNTNQQLKQSQAPQYTVQWSEKKYLEMICQLTGYWEQDLWHPRENPFRDKTKKGLGACIYFERCPLKIKTEIKYACYYKLSNEEWSWTTLHYNGSKYNRIIEWLSQSVFNNESLIDRPLNDWLLSLRSYLVEKGKFFGKTRVRGVKKNGEPKEYDAQDSCIYKFTQIYDKIQNFYDERDEYEKDIWDMRKLGFTDKYVNSSRQHILNFTLLKNSWFYNPTQRFIKYKMPLVSSSTCYSKLLAIKTFYEFIIKNYPNIKPDDINRQTILDYLGYLNTLEITRGYYHKLIADLKDFLEICYRENCVSITGNQLIYDFYLHKYKSNYKPDYIPEEVIKQINQSLHEIKNPVYRRFFTILINCGMRISELCNIRYDCIQQDGHDGLFLRYYQFKLKKEVTIPISIEVANAIKEQQVFVKSLAHKGYPYLFPSTKYKKRIKAMCAKGFCDAIRELIYKKDIRDINGNIWLFHSHQCRHTVGTSMINNGVPQHIVQRYLGHESPTMTQVYAHVHDQTMRKEIEKYYESKVVNFQGETTELEEAVLSSNDDLEWFKKNVQARALEHGYCARPKVLGDCDISGFDGCYNCPHWRTNKNFLPVLKDTLERTNKVLQKAQSLGWQLQINKNTPLKDNLEKVIKALEEDEKQN